MPGGEDIEGGSRIEGSEGRALQVSTKARTGFGKLGLVDGGLADFRESGNERLVKFRWSRGSHDTGRLKRK